MLFSSTLAMAAMSLFAGRAIAQNSSSAQKIGYSGVFTKTDGGLGGTVTVKDPMTLEISSYTLKDASAPALYWWGATNDDLKSGFRISNTQVTQAATSNMLEIKLDAGKTTADFVTVGLWCERLAANFGQATLAAGSGTGTTAGSSASTAPSSSPSSAGAHQVGSVWATMGACVAAVGFAAWMA
ncbi:hypothetical protein BJ875DRAFT_76905 [Amylocarpus encephaloides]|uniref:DM13 domain-containing protein n=1 Tax=Amylocarpus encephaloides TaxID=45428 RepID=A0A9P7YFY1_9HELO|nr:hypothetical protein BJ875DRAFT_76905 [Amylocarpus encephaloides]